LLRLAGVAADGGLGSGRAWVRLQGFRVDRAIVDASVEGVELRGAPLAGARPRLDFERARVRARWQREGAGWRVDAPVLRFAQGGRQQVLDGFAFAGGDRIAAAADRLDAGPLLAVAALSDRVDPAVREWLLAARPVAE